MVFDKQWKNDYDIVEASRFKLKTFYQLKHLGALTDQKHVQM